MHVVNKNTYFCHLTLLRNFSTLFHSNKPVWLHRTRKSEGPCCVTLARNYLEWFITTSSSRTNWHSWSRPLLYHSPSVHPEHWTTNCCYWSNSLVTFNNKKDTRRRIDFNYVHCRRKAAEAAGFLLSSLALVPSLELCQIVHNNPGRLEGWFTKGWPGQRLYHNFILSLDWRNSRLNYWQTFRCGYYATL